MLSADTEYEYSFVHPMSLAYTRPKRLLYFGETISEATTWKQLYLDFMKALYEDYPDKLMDIMGNVYPPSSSPLVGSTKVLKQFITPGEFAPGLVVELNRSASHIVNCIEKFLEICNVDNENIRIFFERKETAIAEPDANIYRKETTEDATKTRRQVPETTERRYSRDDKEAFYRWLKQDRYLAEATCSGYVSAIRSAEDYASKYISSSCKLFCDNQEIIDFTAHALFEDDFFKKKNDKQHNLLFAAIRKYLEYKHISKTNDAELEQTVVEPATKENVASNERILATLTEHFVYGFNSNSPIEMMRFRANYEADHQEQCALNDDELKEIITTCGVSYKGKTYIVDREDRERVRSIILERVQLGDTIFYYDELYFLNEDWLYDGHIIDSDMLKVLLETLFPMYQFKDRFFIANNKRTTELNAIKEAMLYSWGEQVLHSFSELKELLPFIPIDKIRYALSCGKEFTWNSLETYARNDLFVISEEQIEELIRYVTSKCKESGSVTFDELPLEEITAENFDLSETALFEIVFSYLPSSFSRNGRVISLAGENQHDTIVAIQNYCKQHETCTMSELQQIMQDVEGSVRYSVVIEAANAVMVRVSQDDFVADDTVQFDVLGIDKALDDVVVGNGIALKEVTTFGVFPFCGYPWNHFVLESYCRRFSAKYKYACMTPNSQNAGAIIRKSSTLSYHDILAEALARSGATLVEKNAFDFLIDSGLLIRRRYNNMDSLLKKAAVLRKGGD